MSRCVPTIEPPPPCRSSLRFARSSAVRFNPYPFFPHRSLPTAHRLPLAGSWPRPQARDGAGAARDASRRHGARASPALAGTWATRRSRRSWTRTRAGAPQRPWIHAPRQPRIHCAPGALPTRGCRADGQRRVRRQRLGDGRGWPAEQATRAAGQRRRWPRGGRARRRHGARRLRAASSARKMLGLQLYGRRCTVQYDHSHAVPISVCL